MENQTLFLAVLLQGLQDWSFLEHIALLAEPKRGDRWCSYYCSAPLCLFSFPGIADKVSRTLATGSPGVPQLALDGVWCSASSDHRLSSSLGERRVSNEIPAQLKHWDSSFQEKTTGRTLHSHFSLNINLIPFTLAWSGCGNLREVTQKCEKGNPTLFSHTSPSLGRFPFQNNHHCCLPESEGTKVCG